MSEREREREGDYIYILYYAVCRILYTPEKHLLLFL